jgi:pimeloyl-ACP methyl ester carboxylesterase
MKISLFFLIGYLFFNALSFSTENITPYKFSETEYIEGFSQYSIPPSSIYLVSRKQKDAPHITYYFSKPPNLKSFPIALFCTGSSSKHTISSVIHIHRYFLKEFLELAVGLITLEQWGVNNDSIDREEFIHHYTPTQRLMDHRTVINHLLENPPSGWDGTFIFMGVSKGGPLVTALTTEYAHITQATVNWCGAGDWSWRDEVWVFLENAQNEILSSMSWSLKIRSFLPSWMPYAITLDLGPKTRLEYDTIMDKILDDAIKTPYNEFMEMTYQYHADNLRCPSVEYEKIKTPYLVVTGEKDSMLHSSDDFVKKAKKANAPITYFRIPHMDHFIRKRPDVQLKSFFWIKENMNLSRKNSFSLSF